MNAELSREQYGQKERRKTEYKITKMYLFRSVPLALLALASSVLARPFVRLPDDPNELKALEEQVQRWRETHARRDAKAEPAAFNKIPDDTTELDAQLEQWKATHAKRFSVIPDDTSELDAALEKWKLAHPDAE